MEDAFYELERMNPNPSKQNYIPVGIHEEDLDVRKEFVAVFVEFF